MIKIKTTTGEVWIMAHLIEALRKVDDHTTAILTQAGFTHLVPLSIEAVFEIMQQPIKDMLREIAGEGVRLNG